MALPLFLGGLAVRAAGKKLAKKAVKKVATKKSPHPRDPKAAEIDRGIDAFRRDAKKITQQGDARMVKQGAAATATISAGGAYANRKKRK